MVSLNQLMIMAVNLLPSPLKLKIPVLACLRMNWSGFLNPFNRSGMPVRRQEGTGLGLSISRSLIALMGGTLNVSSTPGTGSVLRFEILLPAVSGQKQPVSEDQRRITGIRGKSPLILLVDDNADNLDMLSDLLIPIGFTINRACNGAEGL